MTKALNLAPTAAAELEAAAERPRQPHARVPGAAATDGAEIRTDGRNVETFDRLRHWAYGAIAHYRCAPRERWDEVVNARALMIAEQVRPAHPGASHPFGDHEALATAKGVADWAWLRYDGGSLTRVRADTTVRREKIVNGTWRPVVSAGASRAMCNLAEVHRRRVAASTLRGLGVAIQEIARRLGAGVRSVHRWIAEIRCVPSPCAPSDFEPRRQPTLRQASLDLSDGSVDSDMVSDALRSQCQRPGEGFPSAQPMGGTGCPARSAEPANGVADSGKGGSGGNQRFTDCVHTASNSRDYLRRAPSAVVEMSCCCQSGARRMCEAHTVGRKKKIALSELGSQEDRLRRQRAHDVARALESLHLEGSNVDPETMAIAQRYVDGAITIDELTAAIEARSTDVS
jgi:hypothetical protein